MFYNDTEGGCAPYQRIQTKTHQDPWQTTRATVQAAKGVTYYLWQCYISHSIRRVGIYQQQVHLSLTYGHA